MRSIETIIGVGEGIGCEEIEGRDYTREALIRRNGAIALGLDEEEWP